MFRVLFIISILLPLSEYVIVAKNDTKYNASLMDVENKIFSSSPEPVTYPSQNKDLLRIINGTPAADRQFYYLVSLKRTFPEYGYRKFINMCGGALIATNKILSAGHCFERDGNVCQRLWKTANFFRPAKFFAVAGSLYSLADMESDGQWRRLKRIAVPKHYWFPRNDLAIAFTRKPFVFNDNVKALPYATEFKDYGSITCVVAGFGKTGHGPEAPYSHILLWAHIKLIPAEACTEIHDRSMQDFICVSQVQSDVEHGDSGGPLVCNKTGDPNDKGAGVIVGVVSGSRRGKSFFTRVSSYHRFIARGESCEASCPVSYVFWLSLILLYTEIS